MSGDRSARWALPFLQAGQAQKEIVHNEALALLDMLTQARVEETGTDAPPGSPNDGECWIIGDTPSGAWAGHAGYLAGWTAGGWRFVAPSEGMAVWVASRELIARFIAGDWVLGDIAAAQVTIGGQQVLGERQPAIADPSGGSVVDTESRAALASMLTAMRLHGLIEN